MRKARAFFSKMAGFFLGPRGNEEFSAELATHLQMHTDDNVRAGMSPQEARRQALIKLGGITQTREVYRERHGLPLVETLLSDARFGARNWCERSGLQHRQRHPASSAAVCERRPARNGWRKRRGRQAHHHIVYN